MKIVIDPRKTVQENANEYYTKSKKVKAKIPKLKKAIEQTKKLLEERSQDQDFKQQLPDVKIDQKRDWYQKFHWTKIQDYLFIGGRDAKSNTEIVKKHLEKNDLYFHADIHGAPSFVLKDGQSAPEELLRNFAIFAGAYSRAWKQGLGALDVYAVNPDQVKTAAKAGESLAPGAFVILGERKWFKDCELELSISFNKEDKIMAANRAFYDEKFILIKPDAKETKGNSAKKLFIKLKELFPDKKFELDWIIQVMPNGGSKIVGVY